MTAPYRLREVKPTGTQTGGAFVDYADDSKSGFQVITMPVYPENPRAAEFHLARIGMRNRTPEDPPPAPTTGEVALGLQRRTDLIDIAPGVSLRAAATVLGMSPTDVSGLETGRLDFVDPEDWDRATAAIIAARGSE